MIRFIIKRQWRGPLDSVATLSHETIDIDVPGLEGILLGGFAENVGTQTDIRELVGIEILPEVGKCS